MNDEPNKTSKNEPTFAGEIGAKATRKIKARKSTQGVWLGPGMMGLVGWSVVVPTCWCGARHLVGQTSSRHTRLDTGVIGGRAGGWLFERMVLGGQGRKSNAR